MVINEGSDASFKKIFSHNTAGGLFSSQEDASHRINCHIYYDFKQQRFLLRRKPYYISLEIKFEHTTLNVTLFLAPSLSCPEKSTSCSNADGTNVIKTITGASDDSECGGKSCLFY